MSLANFARQCGIRELVHFTTHKGLLGICFTQTVLPRAQLHQEELLEFILNENAATRTDQAWFDYVNLSINQINRRFFSIAERWHPLLWWAILSFDPPILEHDDVHFCPTNNGYPGAAQMAGLDGLRVLYEEPIDHGFPGWPAHRRLLTEACDPTCPQAEVLYPGPLSTSYLRRVYVNDADNYREACSFLTFLPNANRIEVSIEPDRFAPFEIDPCRGC